MESTPSSLEEIESELLNSLFANLFSYLIQLFTRKHFKSTPFVLGVSYPFYTKSCSMHIKKDRLEVGTVPKNQISVFVPEHKLKPPQSWVRLYISAQNHKCSNTRLVEIKAPASWPAPCVRIHRTIPHGWLNMPNTRMLKSQIIVIWSSVHVLSSVQTSILLCFPTQKPGKWIPKFKHCNYRGNAEMKHSFPLAIFPQNLNDKVLGHQVTPVTCQLFRVHLLHTYFHD